MESSGLPRACSTSGSTLLIMTGWSASHSERAPAHRQGQTVPRQPDPRSLHPELLGFASHCYYPASPGRMALWPRRAWANSEAGGSSRTMAGREPTTSCSKPRGQLWVGTGKAGAAHSDSGGSPTPAKGLTNREHDRVSQLHVADADPGDEANQPWHHIGVIHVNGLGDGLEPVQ